MYSRRTRIEETRNRRKSLIYILLTFLFIVLIIFLGIPAVTKVSFFLTDLRKSSETINPNDTTPPSPPRFESLPESTKETQVEVSGNSEPGSQVILIVNGKNQETLADNEGHFVTKITVSKGENTLKAFAKDKGSNKSAETAIYKIIYDTDAPSLEIAKPQDGSSFYGSKNRQILIEGKTEENTRLLINGRIVIVSSDGSFIFATTLTEGENNFNIKAEDTTGNATEKTIRVNFSL